MPCAALSLLPRIHDLWILSLFGVLAMLIALGSACTSAVVSIVDSPPALAAWVTPLPSVQDVVAVVSACFYAFEGVALVLPVGNTLAPNDMAVFPMLLTTVCQHPCACDPYSSCFWLPVPL